MSNAFIHNRNKVLFEALMSPKFHREKKNFVLKEEEDKYVRLADMPNSTTANAGQEGISTIEQIQRKVDLIAQQIADIDSAVQDCKRPTMSSPSYSISQKEENRCKYLIDRYNSLTQELDNILVDPSTRLLDVINGALDIIGIFDPSGIADLSSMTIYIARGKRLEAFFSFIGAVLPYAGDLLKAEARISAAILEDILKLLFKTPGVEKIMTKILSWVGERGILGKQFADWISSFIFKKDSKAVAEFILGKEIKQTAREIISEKVIQTRMAASLKGQIQLFKQHPVLKSFEYLIATHMLSGQTNREFNEKCIALSNEMKVLEQQTRKGFENTPDYPNIRISPTQRIAIGGFIQALQIYYITTIAKKDPALIAAVLVKLSFTYEIASSYLFQAKNLGFVTEDELNKIQYNMFLLLSDENSPMASAMKSIGEVLKKIIPQFILDYDTNKRASQIAINQVRDKVYETSVSMYPKTKELASKRITSSTSGFLAEPEKEKKYVDMPDSF